MPKRSLISMVAVACVSFAWAACTESGQECVFDTDCFGTEFCRNGTCEGCKDECVDEGVRTCSGNAFVTCGHFDDDPCLEWSHETECGDGEECIDGRCIPESCRGKECTPQEVEEVACGNCGTRTRTCGEDCFWGTWSTCGGEGECGPGLQERCIGQCAGTRSCSEQCRWNECVSDPQGTQCDDGNNCTEQDTCDGAGVCAGTAPQETCNAKDDDCDGIIDTPSCLGTIYRFFHPTNGDHMYKLDETEPDPGYEAETFARFSVYLEQVPGTVPLYQVTNGMDHMLTFDPAEGAGVGYTLQDELGFVATGITWEAAGFAPTRICRYVHTTSGNHVVFTEGALLQTYGYVLEGCTTLVWDYVFDTYFPPLCHLDPDPSCERDDHFLPVVTHWRDGCFEYLGVDQPDLWVQNPMPPPEQYVPGTCYPVYKVDLPDYESYIADTYSALQIPDAEAVSFLSDTCRAIGTPLRLLPPMPWNGNHEVIAQPESSTCEVQIVHASIVDGSLVTVILPPTWTDDAPEGTYPIVINSFYDLNDNLFHVHGSLLTGLVAQSGYEGKRGVIGILTNGGGATASRGFDERMYVQAAEAIAWVADTFHANRHEVITFGGSRGGFTSLAIASNPYGFDYRVILAVSVAPPTILGEHMLLTSPTYPGMLGVAGSDVGLADAWKTGWTYPACAGKPHLTGLTGWQSLLYILSGTSDRQVANQNRSLTSDDFIQGLSNAGTQVYLEITGHDGICPYHLQVEYGASLINEGLPVEAHVLLRNGHMPMGDAYARVVSEAVETIATPGYDPSGQVPLFVEPGVHYWIVDRQSGEYNEIAPAQYPFTFEGPYKIAPGQSYPFVFVGPGGTKFELIIKQGGVPVRTISDALESGIKVLWQNDPPGPTGGPYIYELRIRKPGLDWENIQSTNTPSGTPAELWVLESEPAVPGDAAAAQFTPPVAPVAPATNWGISEY
ncbi:MAG: hypothetical protein JRJ87_10325 [Deltaproteobacteria bacterium]|nr:hypothetical protein [Deltaproteobacteria bacterium]